MSQYQSWDRRHAQAIIDSHQNVEGPMLPILHALQKEFGYIDTEAEALIADALNISQAEVRGTISFYHDFERSPGPAHHIKICRAEACQSLGCETMVEHLKQHHNIDLDQPSEHPHIAFKTVYCLGNCALGPSLWVDEQIIGRATHTMIDGLIKASHQTDLSDVIDELMP
jgi:formate dehydrogenase subunit gamma